MATSVWLLLDRVRVESDEFQEDTPLKEVVRVIATRYLEEHRAKEAKQDALQSRVRDLVGLDNAK